MAKARHNAYSLTGMAPNGTGEVEYWIAKDRVETLYKFRKDKWYELRLVNEVLKKPDVVFIDLKRDGHDDSTCHLGLASCRFTRQGNQLPAPPNMTFLIYAMANLEVFDWGWEESEMPSLTYPKHYQARFGRQLWPTI